MGDWPATKSFTDPTREVEANAKLPWGTDANPKIVDAEKVRSYIVKEMSSRIMMIDGAMGTTIQQYKFNEADFRGTSLPADHPAFGMFKDVEKELKGNNDLLVFTQPDTIYDIHKRYFEAGADFCETNTFSGTWIAQADYGQEEIVYELNRVACELAVKAAAEVTAKQPEKPRMVAGAVGPTNRTLSISPSVEDPGFRNITWDEMVAAYKEQVKGMVDGGCHVILVETIFDTLNAKAALFAIDEYYEESGCPAPGDDLGHHRRQSGRTLSGQTTEASTCHAHSNPQHRPQLLGEQMLPFMQALSASPTASSTRPNAGLPNAMGGYDDTPECSPSR